MWLPRFNEFEMLPKPPIISYTSSGGLIVQILKAVMIAELPDASARTCALCDEKLELMRAVIDHDGKIIHMFECRCGDRVWDD